MLTREVTQLNMVVSLSLEVASVSYTQTGSQARTRASCTALPPMALANMQSGHLWPQDCSHWCLLEHFTLACVFLLGFKMPRSTVELPHAPPLHSLLFVSRCTEIRPQPCSQRKPMAWYFLCSFFRHWHHLFRFFFPSLLLLLIFFSLLPQFSLPSFIAFCFLSASPAPSYVFGFL